MGSLVIARWMMALLLAAGSALTLSTSTWAQERSQQDGAEVTIDVRGATQDRLGPAKVLARIGAVGGHVVSLSEDRHKITAWVPRERVSELRDHPDVREVR